MTIAAQSGVMNHIPAREKWFGYPAQPDKDAKRQILALRHLPEMRRSLRLIEKKLGLKSEALPPDGNEAPE